MSLGVSGTCLSTRSLLASPYPAAQCPTVINIYILCSSALNLTLVVSCSVKVEIIDSTRTAALNNLRSKYYSTRSVEVHVCFLAGFARLGRLLWVAFSTLCLFFCRCLDSFIFPFFFFLVFRWLLLGLGLGFVQDRVACRLDRLSGVQGNSLSLLLNSTSRSEDTKLVPVNRLTKWSFYCENYL